MSNIQRGPDITNSELELISGLNALAVSSATQAIQKTSANTFANVELNVSGAEWGQITGAIANQTDLQNALNDKEDDLTFSTGLTRTGDTITIDSTVVTLTGAQALSNKTGLISQWTNDSGYLTSLTGVTSVSGTADRITSTGGTTPVIDISASYIGQSSITTLGTITTGVWNGTAIANANLANSSITIGSTAISLGATSTTLAGLTSVTSTGFTGALTGNASTATALATGRTISITGDVTYTSGSFDGSGNVTGTGTVTQINGVAYNADPLVQYALLAGRSGGQTIIGGTGVTDDLILQSTSGVGTTGATIRFLVGNNGGTEAMRILNSGAVQVGSATDPFSAQPFFVGETTAADTTEIGVYNGATTGNIAGAVFRAGSDTAQIQFATWASSRTTTRFGTAIGGWAEVVSVTGNGMIMGTFQNAPLRIGTNATLRMLFDTAGNAKLAGTATRATTEGTNHLDIFNGTAPVGTLTNGFSMYSDSGQAKVMDSVGTATLLSSLKASGRSTAQTAAVASVATYTVGAADASFMVSANVLVTTSTTHNFTVTCAYTDEGNTARTLTLMFSSLAGGVVTAIANAAGAVPYMGVPVHIRCKASTAITIATTGTFTTVTYNVEGIIRQIQ